MLSANHYLRRSLLAASLGFGVVVSSHAQDPAGEAIAPGKLVARVAAARGANQTYALYLPSTYDARRAWPIIYAFDPAGRGQLPVEMLREAAEKYGYIVVGSHNSRNGPANFSLEAMQAMWGDTHQRFQIDDRRVYLTGFSGGARVSTMIAKSCGCAAGVIAHGAGYMEGLPPDATLRYSYFAAIGMLDYNYPELVNVAAQLDELKIPHRLRRFDGAHQWAPAEVWMEAVEWMELRAMQEKRRAPDAQFMAAYAQRIGDRAAALAANEPHAAYDEYRQAAADFAGLPEAALFAAKARELENSDALAEARKREQRDIRRQASLIENLYADLEQLRTQPAERNSAASRLRVLLRELFDEAERKKNSPDGVVASRAFSQVNAGIVSLAEAEVFRKGQETAILCYEILTEVHGKQAWPYYQIARIAAELGQKKRALKAFERALGNGLPPNAVQRFERDFPALAADKDFQKLRKS